MKKEIVSFVIGAGVVSGIWLGTTLCKCTSVTTSKSKQSTPILQPNLSKKVLSDVYSAKPDNNFAGLKLYDTDFLIPWNRVTITEYACFDDPNGNYGSANAPMSAFMFRIAEKDKFHYFLTSGRQWGNISELVYLGEDIDIEKVEPAGNGYIMATYKDSKGRDGKAFVAISYITGSEPTNDIGIAQDIILDPLLKYAEKCDPFVWTITPEQLWALLQESLRKNDKMTIAKMITFPMEFNGEQIYTRAEFIERFEEIFYPAYKEFVLKSDASTIWYSWRGAGLPDNCSWLTSASKTEAGPLSIYPDRWLGQEKQEIK